MFENYNVHQSVKTYKHLYIECIRMFLRPVIEWKKDVKWTADLHHSGRDVFNRYSSTPNQ